MKKVVEVFLAVILSVMLLAVVLGSSQAWAVPSEGWNRTYGGIDNDYVYALVETVDGGYALAGYTYSFGTGYRDAWLVKTDADGTKQWNKTYGGTGYDWASALVETVEGGYALAGVTGSPSDGRGDAWLINTDASGSVQWNKTYGGTHEDAAYALVQTANGGYALAGITQSFGAGDYDAWLINTDANGNMQWNKTYGGASDEWASALVETVDEGYALAGVTGSFGADSQDAWLVRTDADGDALWNRTYGGTGNDGALALVRTVDGEYALAGYTWSLGAGADDFWLVKTNTSGNAQWNITYGGTDYDGASALVQTVDGGYALAGSTASFGVGGYDFWLVKTDENGVDGVIPEFPSSIVPMAFVATVTFVAVLTRRKQRARFTRSS